jgi:Zn-dependent protease with chaperone function
MAAAVESTAPGVPVAAARPFGFAAGAVSWSAAALGLVGTGSFALVAARLLEAWRVGPAAGAHRASLFGVGLSYPAANAAAVGVLAFAVVGLACLGRAVSAAANELQASRRVRRMIEERRLFDATLPSPHAQPVPARDFGAVVIEDPAAHAFCAGLWKPTVCITTGALARVDPVALELVLAHERHHALRRDPLRQALCRVIAQSLFFAPGLQALARAQRELAELGADEAALRGEPARRVALARAVLSFHDAATAAGSIRVASERVDHLLGDLQRPRLPIRPGLTAAAALALFAAAEVLAGAHASAAATLAPPLLSSRPCVVVAASLPTLGLFAAVWLIRRAVPARRR